MPTSSAPCFDGSYLANMGRWGAVVALAVAAMLASHRASAER
jgi:hypothetical protein